MMAILLSFVRNWFPQPPLQLWVTMWPSSGQWAMKGRLLAGVVLGSGFLPMEETNAEESLLSHSCLWYWCDAYNHKRKAKRITIAKLQPWHLLEDSNDLEGWVWVSQVEKGRKDIWESKSIINMRRSAQRCSWKVGLESNREDFVCSSVIYCQNCLIQSWGWFPACWLIHHQSMSGIFPL